MGLKFNLSWAAVLHMWWRGGLEGHHFILLWQYRCMSALWWKVHGGGFWFGCHGDVLVAGELPSFSFLPLSLFLPSKHLHVHLHAPTCTPTCTPTWTPTCTLTCTYMYTYMHLHVHLHAPTCTYMHLHVHLHAHLHAPTCTPTWTYIYTYMHLHIHLHVHLHAPTYTPTCTYMYLIV